MKIFEIPREKTKKLWDIALELCKNNEKFVIDLDGEQILVYRRGANGELEKAREKFREIWEVDLKEKRIKPFFKIE